MKQDDHAVYFDDITKSYLQNDMRVVVMESLTFGVRHGEFVSIVGPSGIGKTTLLNLVAGFERPDSGSVTAGGQEIDRPDRSRTMVFQQYAVFPWLTVRENIAFSLNLDNAKRRTPAEITNIVDHYLELMGLTRFANALPKMLSGGMKQRVAIARAYAAEPAILLMDEPFGALDAQTRDQMQELLLTVAQQERTTVLFVTHSMEEAVYLSDTIIVLRGRPATIAQDVTVKFPSARTHDIRFTDHFLKLRSTIEKLIAGTETRDSETVATEPR
jgi:NitT/TauT family transport system ATP-binding protein